MSDLEAILYSPSAIIGHYLLVVSVSVSIGAIIGFGSRWKSAPIWSENRLWEYYFNKVDDDEFQLRVATTEGTLLEGRIDKYGESVAKRDIVLRKPRTITVTDEGETEEIESWTGSVYVHNQDISYVMIDELSDAEKAVVESNGNLGDERETPKQTMGFDESEPGYEKDDRRQELLSRYEDMVEDTSDSTPSNRIVPNRILSLFQGYVQGSSDRDSCSESGTDEATPDNNNGERAEMTETDDSPADLPEQGDGSD